MTRAQMWYLIIPLAPLLGAIIAGLFGRGIGRIGAHVITIALMLVSFVASLMVFFDVLAGHTFNGRVYTWAVAGDTSFEIGFLIDRLSAIMMVVVNSVSLMVHIYTIGYMHDDPGYQRFFSYISLFTFAMLMLVMSNNFLQLFFGWEAVGLVSYLLIGFWYTRPTAIYANMKAFLVNRFGDFGFLIGIALVLAHFGTLDYAGVFALAPKLAGESIEIFGGTPWALMTVICIALFIGAMGKSAQVPLHVWLPDSMEGPTPISALIHAATMVTAGIFMVARMSPLFELSQTALSFVLVIGAITALSMALVAIVQNDIKRVVAYSTLSQLGYMTVALGASAYAAGIFHLATHAFFKAVLFLGAGSVIIAMHHEQDLRKMGGLKRYMPITYFTVLIAALASAGVPGFSGFFSKDAIIEATKMSHVAGAGFAYFCITACVFVTALYTFRLLFLAFHGKGRMDHHTQEHLHETPAVVTLPLILLAIPAAIAGWFVGPVVFGDYFGSSIRVSETMHELASEFHGPLAMMLHSVQTLPFWLSMAGIATAWFLYLKRPDLPARLREKFALFYNVLDRKYGFDELYSWLFASGGRNLGAGLWRVGDIAIIDGIVVNGSAKLVGAFAGLVRRVQSGFIYHYAFLMIIGVVIFLSAFLAWRHL